MCGTLCRRMWGRRRWRRRLAGRIESAEQKPPLSPMQYPLPKHLVNLLEVQAAASSEDHLHGAVKCPCGSVQFTPLFVADLITEPDQRFLRVKQVGEEFYLRIGARCSSCSQTHLLFDDHFHGWNGYVCTGEEARRLPRPEYQEWVCHRCKSPAHRISLDIQGEDMKVSLTESDGFLTKEDWFEGFGWFTVRVTCSACGCGPTTIVDYETM